MTFDEIKKQFEKSNVKICRKRRMITYRFIENDGVVVVEIDGSFISYDKQEFKDLFWEIRENNSKNNPILDEIPEVRSSWE